MTTFQKGGFSVKPWRASLKQHSLEQHSLEQHSLKQQSPR